MEAFKVSLRVSPLVSMRSLGAPKSISERVRPIPRITGVRFYISTRNWCDTLLPIVSDISIGLGSKGKEGGANFEPSHLSLIR